MPKPPAPADNRNPAIGIYVTAVGAAAVTTFFDRVRNEEVSALRKTGIALREMVESGDVTSGYLSMFALLIFCLVSAFMVFVYKPREPKEAFVLGMGVLAAVGMTVAPPKSTNLHVDGAAGQPPKAANEVPAKLTLSDAVLGLFPSANAQTKEAPAEPRRAGVWVFLEGPQQLRTPETRVLIYALQSKTALVNSPANAAFYIALPPGSYQFELNHVGYRSVAFSATLESGTQVLQVPMEQVNVELQNFFGPTRTKVRTRPEIARQLDGAQAACASGGGEQSNTAKSALAGIDKRWLKALSPEARHMLCV
ncbi:hypothetical protein [Roseateles sp. P5_E4]